MASLRNENDRGRTGWRLQYRLNRRNKSLWLGNISEGKATDWKAHVEHLVERMEGGDPPSKATGRWLSGLSDADHKKLSDAGLVEPRVERNRQVVSLAAWCDTFISERSDVKGSTRQTYEKGRDCLVAHFGASKPIREIRPEDAKRWRIWLATEGNRRDKNRSTMADATVRRRTGKAKQFFAEALERGLIDQNPFAKLPSHVAANTARQFFVPAAWIERCIEVAPDVTWRTILALARYGGLRCPSELLRLKWCDVNLPEGRMTIHASKTEHHGSGGIRQCPIFPELRPYLESAWDARPEGAVYVIDRYRGTGVNLRTRFETIIKAAGLVPWPKLMQNLRASRETELMAKFPAKDVASWLGNSVPVAMAHYAMATAESFRQAIEIPVAVAVAVASGGQQQTPCSHQPSGEKAKSQQKTAPRGPLMFSDASEISGKWAIQNSNL